MRRVYLSLVLTILLGAGCWSQLETAGSEADVQILPPNDYYIQPDDSDQTAPPTTVDPEADICVNRCGNGTCEEIVCLGTGCPCSESIDTCPQDCSVDR
jgi:hypothetical protein